MPYKRTQILGGIFPTTKNSFSVKKICFFIGLLIGLGACKHPIPLVPPIDYYAKYSIPYVLDTTRGTRRYCGIGEFPREELDTNYRDFYITGSFFNKTNPYEIYLFGMAKKTRVEGLWSFNFQTGQLKHLQGLLHAASCNGQNELLLNFGGSICTMNGDGTNLTLIVPSTRTPIAQVMWSPDGNKIVYRETDNRIIKFIDKRGNLLDTIYNAAGDLSHYYFVSNDELLMVKYLSSSHLIDSMNVSLYQLSTRQHRLLPIKNAGLYGGFCPTPNGSRLYYSSSWIEYFDWKTYEYGQLPSALEYYGLRYINVTDYSPQTGKLLCTMTHIYYPPFQCKKIYQVSAYIMNLDGSDIREIIIPAP
jgi:hypothetical protein